LFGKKYNKRYFKLTGTHISYFEKEGDAKAKCIHSLATIVHCFATKDSSPTVGGDASALVTLAFVLFL
jgi:hypothetical protein